MFKVNNEENRTTPMVWGSQYIPSPLPSLTSSTISHASGSMKFGLKKSENFHALYISFKCNIYKVFHNVQSYIHIHNDLYRSLKGTLAKKLVTSENAVFQEQFTNFLFHGKDIFRPWDIQFFIF